MMDSENIIVKENKLTKKKRLRDNNEIKDKDEQEVNYSEKIQLVLNEINNAKEHWDIINQSENNNKFVHGNYIKFYFNKFLDALKDPRMNFFDSEIFAGKKCLDIGCNDGTLTIMIAKCYQPNMIRGIDIDYKLVKNAIKHVKYITRNELSNDYMNSIINKENSIRSESMKSIITKLQALPKSFLANLGNTTINDMDNYEKLSNLNNNNSLFPSNILFSQENYVSQIFNEEKYDTILCLNTSKWIHLNWGDTGIKTLFHNVYSQLKNDGLFVFQPQNWKSYKKRKNMSSKIQNNFLSIKLQPKLFKEYLENTYGFKCIKISNPPSNSKLVFDRPIMIFKKVSHNIK